MAIFFDAPVEPDALTTFIREVPTPGDLRLQSMFGRREVPSNRVDFAEIVRTNRTARYRSYDGRIHVSERDTGSIKEVDLIPLSSSLSMGEYERLQLQFAQTGGTNQQALARSIYNDATNLTREVLARREQAWGDVLTDGVLNPAEYGGGTSDFGVPNTHLVTAGTAWTTVATASALSDLVAWVDVYIATNGFAPGSMLPSTRVSRLFQRNQEIINAISGDQTGRTRVTRQELNDLLSSEGLPTLLEPYDTVVDVDGTSTRVIPDDKLVFLPPNPGDLGYLASGVSATALELVNSNESDLSFEEATGIVGVIEKIGPPYRQFTYVDAVEMPVLANSRLLFVADVA
ncbi:MAG: hypothetical protein JWP14_3384 [Frankiales bacterium]|nr:hypothetical protein [Frankiales bacterium]